MNKAIRKRISRILVGAGIITMFAVPVSAQEKLDSTSNEEVTLSESQAMEDDILISPRSGYWNVYKQSGAVNSIQADFVAGIKTTTTNYGLVKGRYVNQAYVRLQEGSYDSGRKFSGNSGGIVNNVGRTYSTPKVSKTNNPLATAKMNWGWFYA